MSLLSAGAISHSATLLFLAFALCALGSLTAARLLSEAIATAGITKLGWIFFAARVAGITAWTAHFASMLRLQSLSGMSYDPVLTVLSMLVTVGGLGLGMMVSTLESKVLPAFGGFIMGLTIALMHYIGIASCHFDAPVQWDGYLLGLSTLLSGLAGALAMMSMRGQLIYRHRCWAAPALLFCMVGALHLVSLEVIEITEPAAHVALPAETLALGLITIAGAALIVVAGSFAQTMDQRAQRKSREQLAQLARTDALTGLLNRSAFDQSLERRISQATKGDCFGLIAFEVANINAINQQFGHRIGNLVIQAFANRLLEARRQGVELARTGGAQFCGMGKVLDKNDALTRTTRLFSLVSRNLLIEGHEIAIDARLSGVTFPEDAQDSDDLMRKVQAALSRAIADPLHPVLLHDEVIDGAAQYRLSVANALRGALDRNEFEVVYQPQVWIADRHVLGYEALLRWRHPELGIVSPSEFIPIAERTGCIVAIGLWVLRTACAEAVRWGNERHVAVNVSPLQLRQADLPEAIAAALTASGLPPERLEIEVTESLLIDDLAGTLRTLHQIQSLGVRLALDDFGTGYSSMDVLRRFAFNKVKLDKSFVHDVEHDRRARAILRAMLELGRQLSIPILVEGVETPRQLAILRAEGCKKVQGYLTGRPVPAAEISLEAPPSLKRSA